MSRARRAAQRRPGTPRRFAAPRCVLRPALAVEQFGQFVVACSPRAVCDMDSLQHRIEHTEKESFDLKLVRGRESSSTWCE